VDSIKSLRKSGKKVFEASKRMCTNSLICSRFKVGPFLSILYKQKYQFLY